VNLLNLVSFTPQQQWMMILDMASKISAIEKLLHRIAQNSNLEIKDESGESISIDDYLELMEEQEKQLLIYAYTNPIQKTE